MSGRKRKHTSVSSVSEQPVSSVPWHMNEPQTDLQRHIKRQQLPVSIRIRLLPNSLAWTYLAQSQDLLAYAGRQTVRSPPSTGSTLRVWLLSRSDFQGITAAPCWSLVLLLNALSHGVLLYRQYVRVSVLDSTATDVSTTRLQWVQPK